MNSEEKIRLVLETLGVDDVKQATKAMKDLAAGIASVDTSLSFLDMGEFARDAKNMEQAAEEVGYSINKLGRVTMPGLGEATHGSKKGFEQYSESIHHVAMGLEDLQYGFRGIQNNIPGIARAFGAGAGLAGVVSLASTAFAVLGPKVLELIEGLETKKVKEKIGDLVGSFSDLSTKVEGLKKSLDELKKSEDTSIVNILKAKSATEELTQAETELEAARENAAAAKAAREKQTDAGAQELTERKEAYKESAVDFGQGKAAQQDTLASLYDANMKGFDPKKQSLLEYGKKYGVKPGNEVAHFKAQRAMANPDEAQMTDKDALESIMGDNGFDQKGIAAAQQKAQELSEKQRDEIFGQLEKAKTLEEFDEALRKLAEVNPKLAAQISGRLDYDQGISKNELVEKRTAEQKNRLDKERAVNQKKLSADPRMGKAGEEEALLGGRAVKMQKSKGDFDQQELEAWDKAGLTKEEWTAQQKSLADVAKNRNEAISKLDPFQAAAQRQLQAGTGPNANRNMAALRQRDSQLFQQKLMAGGMGKGEAEESAKQSLTGGDKQLNDFAKMSGNNTKSVIGMNRAAQLAMQRLEATQNEQQRQMDIQAQNFNQIQNNNNAGRPRWQGGARSR
jgi:hypothetical protein